MLSEPPKEDTFGGEIDSNIASQDKQEIETYNKRLTNS